MADKDNLSSKDISDSVKQQDSLNDSIDLGATLSKKMSDAFKEVDKNIADSAKKLVDMKKGLLDSGQAIKAQRNIVSSLNKTMAEDQEKLQKSASNAKNIEKDIKYTETLIAHKQKEMDIGRTLGDLTKEQEENIKKESEILTNKIQIQRASYGLELMQKKILVDKVKETSKSLKVNEDMMSSIKKQHAVLSEQYNKEKENHQTLVKTGKLQAGLNILASESDRLLSKTSDDYSKIRNLIGSLKSPMSAFVALIAVSIERWIELDRTAGEFRKKTGLLTTQMTHIEKAVRQVNVEMSNLGVTLEKAYESAASLYGAFGTTALVTKDMIGFTAKMEANLGIASKDVAMFHSKFSEISKSTGTTTQNVVLATAKLSEMAGVAPSEVMKDMANASEETLMFLSKNPMQLMRATVEARRMGTTIESIAKSARTMLNFQDSINSEMEASALSGRNVNFQLSRQLAFEGKIVESREAALKTLSSIGDFSKMNVYQQEALAKASGMTVEEILKQQNQTKMLNALKNSSDKADIKKYDDYVKMDDAIKANSKRAQDDLVGQGRALAENQLRQTEMEKLSNSITAAWTDLSDALLPIANTIMPIIITSVRVVASLFKVIGGVISGMLKPLDFFVKGFRSGEAGAIGIEKVLVRISNKMASIGKWFSDSPWASWLVGGVAITGMLLMWGSSIKGLAKNILSLPSAITQRVKNVFNKPTTTPDLTKVSESSKKVPAGKGVKDFLVNLAAGLKAMGNPKVLFGAVNLIPASIGLVAMIPGFFGAKLLSKIDGDELKKSLSGLASGLKKMSSKDVFLGSLALVGASIGFIAMIPGAIGMGLIALLGIPFSVGAKGMASGLSSLAKPQVFLGALAIASIGASIIPLVFALNMMKGIEWKSLGVAAAALVVFSAAAFGLGALMMSGVGAVAFIAGAAAITILGASLVVFGYGAKMVAEAIEPLSKGFVSMVDPLKDLGKYGPGLISAALGITAVGVAMTAFGAGSAAAGLGSFVGKFLGGDMFSKLKDLSSMKTDLMIVADSLTAIQKALSSFASIDSGNLKTIVGQMRELKNLSEKSTIDELMGVINTVIPTKSEPPKVVNQTNNNNQNEVVVKLEELIGLLKSGAIGVNMDSRKVSAAMSSTGRG